MHSIYEHMLKRQVFRAGLALGFLLVLTSCGDMVDKAGSVELGKGVDANSNFGLSVSQMTLTLSVPTQTNDGGLAFSATITNPGSQKVCASTYKDGNAIKIGMGVGLYDRTGQHGLAITGPVEMPSFTDEDVAVYAAVGPNYVIPANSTAKIAHYIPPHTFLPFFFGREKDYHLGDPLTAGSSLMVFLCKYNNLEVVFKTGEYAGITSQLVGPFKVPDEVLFGKQVEN